VADRNHRLILATVYPYRDSTEHGPVGSDACGCYTMEIWRLVEGRDSNDKLVIRILYIALQGDGELGVARGDKFL
jgi:hypothetical protein